MSEQTPDLYEMPLDDLRKLIMDEAAKAETTDQKAAPVAQARNADGTFAAANAADQKDEFDNSADDKEDDKAEAKPPVAEVTDEEEEDEPEEYIFRREIDLGDGSGKRVYTGKGATKEEALEQLTDKLAEAQTHAAKTIYDFQRKYPKTEAPKVKQFTPEEELILTQEFQTKPSEAFKKMYKEIFGETVEQAQVTLADAKQAVADRRSSLVQQNFVNTHPDYIPNAANGDAIRNWALAQGEPDFTEANLEKAYQALKKSGLLKLKTVGADDATATNAADQKRTVSTDTGVTQQRSSKKGSTITARSRTAPTVKTAPTEDELYSMPMDELRKLTVEQLAKNQE